MVIYSLVSWSGYELMILQEDYWEALLEGIISYSAMLSLGTIA